MQSLRDIKRRIRSVKNIAQITKAMEVVSMNKMRRSQQFALAARPYAVAALRMLKNIVKGSHHHAHYLKDKKATESLLVVVTADKGLVGGFNEAVLKKAEAWIQEKKNQDIPFHIIAVGKKAKEFFDRQHIPLAGQFTGFGDYTHIEETVPLTEIALSGFDEKKWDSVEVLYTHFKTTLKQETLMRKVIPAHVESLEEIIAEIIPEYGRFSELRQNDEKSRYNYQYKFEPSAEKIIELIVSDILKVAFHHMLLESNASEHSARMVTMKSASDNAHDLQGALTLQMNKARQAGITAEISEIIAGAEALK